MTKELLQYYTDSIWGKIKTSFASKEHTHTKAQVGLGNVDNTSDANKPVSTAQQTAIDNTLSASKSYTDTKVANLVGSAPETLNTLEEIATAIEENEDVVTALNSAIGNKANQSDLETLQSTVNNKANKSNLEWHSSNKTNPHSVTKSQVGLGNVDNTSDANKPISTATQTALNNVQGAIDELNDNVEDVQTQIDETIKRTDVVNLARYVPTVVSTSTVTVKTHNVTKKGLLCTSFIMFENSAGVTNMNIAINGQTHSSMSKSNDTPSVSLCTIVNAGEVITWTVKANGSGSNNTLINGFILNLE